MNVPVYGMIYVVAFWGLIYLVVKITEHRENVREETLGYKVEFLSSGRLGELDTVAITYRSNLQARDVYFYGQEQQSKYVFDFTQGKNKEALAKLPDIILVQQRIVEELKRHRLTRNRVQLIGFE